MKKRVLLGGLFLSLVVCPALARADAATKLSRGVNNTLFGWFEIINEIGNESDQHGFWIGLPSGLFRGTTFMAGRMLAGVYEIVTFPFPNGSQGYAPVVLPESVFKRR